MALVLDSLKVKNSIDSSGSVKSPDFRLSGAGASSNASVVSTNGEIIPSGVGNTLASSLSTILSSTPAANNNFGSSCSIYGDTAVVGSPNDSGKGAIFIFNKSGGVWSFQTKLVGSDTVAGDFFGVTVSLYKNTLIVGANSKTQGANTNAGSAYVFVRSGGAWSQQAILVPSTIETTARFGSSLSIYEDTAVVGAPYENLVGADRGAVYVFVRTGTSWSLETKLVSTIPENFAVFGLSVSLYIDTLAIGSSDTVSGFLQAGRVYVFARDRGSWSLSSTIVSTTPETSSLFGTTLSMFGGTLAVSAYLEDQGIFFDVGAIYIFVASGTVWEQQAKITAITPENNLFMGGYGVSLYADTLIFDTNPSTVSGVATPGQVLVYTRTGSSWSLAKTLTAPVPKAIANFGGASSIYGNTIVIGTPKELVTFSNQGAAYVFDASLDVPKINVKDLVIKNSAADLTLASTQTTSQTLNFPNITQADTALVSLLPQTAYKKAIIGGQDGASTTVGSASTPSFVVSAGNVCNDAVFSPDGLTLYICIETTKSIYGYSLIKQSNGTTSATLVSTWTFSVLQPSGISMNFVSATDPQSFMCVTSKTSGLWQVWTTGALDIPLTLTGASTKPFPSPTAGWGFYTAIPAGNRIAYISNTLFSTPPSYLDHAALPGLTISNPIGVVAKYIVSEEVYIANGSGGVAYATVGITPSGAGSLSVTFSAPAGTISIVDTLTLIAADRQRPKVYVLGTNKIYVIDTTTKTVSNTVNVVFPSPTPKYLLPSNDAKYLYGCSTNPSIFQLNLDTLVQESTFGVLQPTAVQAAVPSLDSSVIYIIGNGISQVASNNIKRTQYTAYRVGQASQAGNTITGYDGPMWSRQMCGGVIVFENGITGSLPSSSSSFSGTTITSVSPSQTVARQNYTIYYGVSVSGPNGSGIAGDGSVLINPRIVHSNNSTTSISFNMAGSVVNSELVLTTSQSSASSQVLAIPNIASSDTIMTLGTVQAITGAKTFNAVATFSTAPVITSITNGGTVTIPTGTDTLANLNSAQTLTNKTLNAPILSYPFLVDSLWVSQAAPPAGFVKIYGESRGTANGRAMASQKNSAGRDYSFQPFLATKKVSYASAIGYGGVTTLSTFGMIFTPILGTATTPTNLFFSFNSVLRVLTLSTGAAATNTSAYFAHSSVPADLFLAGNATQGGFHFVCKFAIFFNLPALGTRFFVGMTSGIPSATADPMAVGAGNRMIGLAKNAGTANLQFYARTAATGAASGTSTGLSWSAPTAATVYTFSVYQPPSATSAFVSLESSLNGVTVSTFQSEVITNYPGGSVFPILWINSGTQALNKDISILSLYIETED